MSRWMRYVAAMLMVVMLIDVTSAASEASGHDPVSCKPDDTRLPISGSFFLDACFDGTYLLVLNRSSLPLYVDVQGDLTRSAPKPYSPGVHSASALAVTWAPHLLPPDFQMRVRVGATGGKLSLGYADDTGRKFAALQRLTALLPSVTALPDVLSQFLTEGDAAFVQLVSCQRDPNHQNFLQQSRCAATYMGDMVFAAGRLGLTTALSLTTLRTWLDGLKDSAEAGLQLRELAGALRSYYGSQRMISVPAGLTGHVSVPSTPPPASPSSPTGSPTPPRSPVLAVSGTCTSAAGTLSGASSGFTPGGTATIRAWRPDGSPYAGIVSTSRVGSTGAIRWSWPCAGDPPGTYTTEAVDNASGRSTGRVSFTIGSPPASTVTPPASTPPLTPPPAARPEPVGVNSHTWTNYTNAGGSEGPTIPQGTTVAIACRLTGFRVANGNTWWYRIASSRWNSAYYVSADAFYNNGQTSGSLHGTPWVDEAVPAC